MTVLSGTLKGQWKEGVKIKMGGSTVDEVAKGLFLFKSCP